MLEFKPGSSGTVEKIHQLFVLQQELNLRLCDAGTLVVRALHRHRKGVGSIPAGELVVDEFF